MGIEVELQLVNLQHFNLAMEAKDFLRRISTASYPGEIKPEITQGMIEINSSIHTSYDSLLNELSAIRNFLTDQAGRTHIGICGGGTHPFQSWRKQRIFPTERFDSVSQQYGYLAKQFTVFGQHIHIACASGDDALYLCHALARYIPHFIALSAASPFNQGVDTNFDCSRLTAVSSFPLSGTPPWILVWEEFEAYYQQMIQLEIISSMKDFYWDIRPKPEYGTVEIRICDTPLTLDKAADLAAYAQALSAWLLDKRPRLSRDIYLSYLTNRFRAARYGLTAIVIDPIARQQISLEEDILSTCEKLTVYFSQLQSLNALEKIRSTVSLQKNGASWLRTCYAQLDSLSDVVRSQVDLWANEPVPVIEKFL